MRRLSGRTPADPPDEGGRLDPVRWRRPRRVTVIRWAAVAVLLCAAAVALRGLEAPGSGTASAAEGDPGRAGSPGNGDSSAPRSDGATADGLPGGSAAGGSTGAGADNRAGAGVTDPAVVDRRPVPPGSVGVPLRLADSTALSLIGPGDRVDLLRSGDGDRPGTPIARNVPVLAVTGAGDPLTGGLLLALSPADARRAVAGPGRGYAVVLLPAEGRPDRATARR